MRHEVTEFSPVMPMECSAMKDAFRFARTADDGFVPAHCRNMPRRAFTREQNARHNSYKRRLYGID